jgi:hypothetical protein
MNNNNPGSWLSERGGRGGRGGINVNVLYIRTVHK